MEFKRRLTGNETVGPDALATVTAPENIPDVFPKAAGFAQTVIG
jgi:hypothetical protein